MADVRQKIRVALIFGGRSGEHEVSLVSARGIMAAIDKEKYEVVPIGITKGGRWIAGGDPLRALQSGLVEGESKPAALLGDPSQQGLLRLEQRERGLQAVRLSEVDVVFPVLHGPYGEDGTVQGLLEMADLPYVGAGVLGSALGMDKVLQKRVLRDAGLPVVPHVALLRRDWEQNPKATIERILETVGCPCFVKPANLGSSVGIGKAHTPEALPAALDEAALYDRKLLVEEAIDARDVEVSVLGNDDPIASVPGEIVPCNEFYDYEAKYIANDSELLIPAPLSAALTGQVQEMAVRAYKAIDCAGMARVDFFVERGTRRLYVNELNTIPGFTPISMYPKLWEASGISYTELIDRLLELALERHRDKGRSKTSYAPK
jgi:D-alanine-D-alanine ligase